jgi:hypothetical protein
VEDEGIVPTCDHNKLSISGKALADVTSSFGMPLGAIFAFSRNSTETGSGFRRLPARATTNDSATATTTTTAAPPDTKEGTQPSSSSSSSSWDYWCLIPTRAVRDCHDGLYVHEDDNWDDARSHGEFSASKLVHLPGQECDLTQAHVGVWVGYDAETGRSAAVVLHREDELRLRSFKNATSRVADTLKRGWEAEMGPLFVVLIYLARAVRMWGVAAWEVNREVIKAVCFLCFLSLGLSIVLPRPDFGTDWE